MTRVDVSNPDLLRSVDPIKKAVYDEEGTAKFHIGHLHEPPPADLYGWADKERGKKVAYEMIGAGDANNEQWELDVKPLISSTKWLQVHGLRRNRLTMKQILSAIGFKHNEVYVQTLGRPVGSYYGSGLFQQFKRKDGQLYNITVGREKLQKIEESLLRASHLFKRRMEWLTTGSRRIFGVIQEHCVCFVLDVTTMSQTQFDLYRESLCEVIRTQVSQLAKFNMIKAQADMEMWQEQAMPVTEVTIKNAIDWVNKLDRMAESSRTGCAEAILKAMEDDSLESVYLFAEGDSCELSKELLRQKLVDAPHVLHTVSFNATKAGTIKFLREISSQTTGRFHGFVVKNAYEEDAEALPTTAAPPGGDASKISVRYAQKARGGIPAGAGVREDVYKIWCELEECRNNHAQVVTLLTEIPDPKTEAANIHRPAITDGRKVEQYMSSRDWLKRYGLESLKLTAFQVLASCSFKHVDGVVDLKGKPGPNNTSSDAENVRKLVNAKYCDQFAHTEWKDGTLVHVHVTAEQHRVYEKRMKVALDAIQKRLDWLQQGSREVFGTILEEQVYILIDTSLSMKDKLPMLKEKLFQLMQEQLRHKNKFNIIQFGTKATAWSDRACDVSEQNLVNAWTWVKDIGVGGSTNTLAALRIALSDPHTHAIYLLTDGRPDQHPRSVLAQVQLQHPVPIHTIAFNCNDLEANKFLHQLSSDTGGRYHNFTSNGSLPDAPPPFESEDISLLKAELEKGKRDLEKVSKLRAQCVMLDWYHNKKHKNQKPGSSSPSSTTSQRHSRSLSGPRRPSSALARRENSFDKSGLSQRPNSSTGYYGRSSYSNSSPDNLSVAHRNHRGHLGTNDPLIKRKQSNNESKGSNRAGHTKTSLLRLSGQGETRGWLLPETQEFMDRQLNKSMEAYQDIMRLKVEAKQSPPKKKKERINPLDVPNATWLKKNGLVARKLVIMDILTPTVVKVKPKYIPVLSTNVVSKVFNDVLPIAHVSPRNNQEIRLVNPAAVDLPGYDVRLKRTLDEYHQRLDLQVWRKLSQEEREKFEKGPVSYINNKDALNQALDTLGWPISPNELQLLEDEIHLGERYLQQSQDLQRTAKKVAMGRKKKKPKKKSSQSFVPNLSSSDSSSDLDSDEEEKDKKKNSKFSQSAGSDNSDSLESDNSENFETPKKLIKAKSTKLDKLKGHKVIARDEIDGFYYRGVVVKSKDARHALVNFFHGNEAIVPSQFIIPVSGAVPCPPLKVGDRVLAFSKKDSNVVCYVPGIVLGTPRRSQVHNKFYTILKYDNTKTSLVRKKIFKISDQRYSFAVRYIEHASQINYSVPPVDFVEPVVPDEPSYVSELRESLQNLEVKLNDNSEVQQEQKELLRQQLDEIDNAKKEAERIAAIEENMREQLKELKKHDASVNTEPLKEDVSTDTIMLTDDHGDANQSYQPGQRFSKPPAEQHKKLSISNAFPTPTSDSSTMTEVSSMQEKEDNVEISINETSDSAMITRNDEGVFISRYPPQYITRTSAVAREQLPRLEVGQEILFRSNDDGWYYSGTIQASHSDDSYDILDTTGFSQQTYREDIVTEKDDGSYNIEDGNNVIALHPQLPYSYAPASVVECKPNGWYSVQIYDKVKANLPRENIYWMHPDKFKQDVNFIIEREKKWVGETVIARYDNDGRFHLASCRSRVGSGHEYILMWGDGSESRQQLECMFSRLTRRRPFDIGDCAIALSDTVQLIYLPGRVMATNNGELTVSFCDQSRSKHVRVDQCFWVSKQYYDFAVGFYRSRL